MTSSQPNHVVVLCGGPSAEREVSLISGREVAQALKDKGYRISILDAKRETFVSDLQRLAPDAVFNALHGRWGEDGCVQGVLEWLQIPYTHSGVFASALAMDKIKTKAVYQTVDLPVAESFLADKAAVMAAHPMQPPYVIKPYNEGSSVGVYIVAEQESSPVQLMDNMPDQVMVERFIKGRELTCSVLGDRPLCVTDIQTDGWYDFAAKYELGGSCHVIPADVPTEIFDACMDYALRAHQVLGCRGLSRTDFRWDDTQGLDGLVLLETNTQPGMTPTSLSPEQAQYCGMSFGDLIDWMIRDASCHR